VQLILLSGGGGEIAGCVIDLGGGCGVPNPPHLGATLTTPPPTLTISIDSAVPNAPGLLAAQFPPFSAPIPLTPPCTLAVDPSSPATLVAGSFMTGPAGTWQVGVTPIPAVFDVRLQAAILALGQPLGLYQLTNGIEVARPGPCPPCTYTLQEWGANTGPSAMLYDANWLSVFPAGMDIGLFNGGAPGFGLHWTPTVLGRTSLKTFLQTFVGFPGALTADAVNPTSTTTGTFGRLTAVLQLNIAFNAAGLLGSANPGFGAFVYSKPGDPLTGFTVSQILALCNQVLAGVTPPPGGHTFVSLTDLLENLHSAFAGCVPSTWAQTHLDAPLG
jgi:hypothetical protein